MPATVESRAAAHVAIPRGRGASRRLAQVLREQLTTGEFGPGDQLPTLRELMEKFNVCYSVANRAAQSLVCEGLAERQKGRGMFVRERSPAEPVSKRMDAFALVLGSPTWNFHASLFQGVNSVTDELHYQTIVCDSEDDIDHQAMILLRLMDNRVAGIAIVPTIQPKTPAYQLRPCQDLGIPVVLLHRDVEGLSAPLISLPFEEIGYRAGRALMDQGHRRVACLYNELYEATEGYVAGLRRALEERGETLPDSRLFCSNKPTVPMPPEHEKFLENVLAGFFRTAADQRPTAIVAINPDDAEWMYVHLLRTGVRVPEEMSLITIDSSLRQRMLDAQLTAVTIDEVGVGRLAAQLLDEMGRQQRPINNRDRFTAPLDFHAGRTLGPAPPSTEKM